MSETRRFHLGDVLSVTTGKLVSLRHMDGVYDILNFMTRENLFTHQLPRACREAAPEIFRQHPDLAEIVAPELTPDTVRVWLDDQIARYGEERELRPMVNHAPIDPLLELASMTDKPIVTVTVDGGER